MAIDSLHFKDSIHNAHVTRTEVMVSFDIESLFTSVPIKEVLVITKNLLLLDDGLENL